MEVTDDMRAAVYSEMLSDDYDSNSAMLLAASEIPLERENGGLEYPAIKAFRAMVRAQAQARGINIK